MSSIITRKFEFDYGHRVLGHEGKCATLHGHRGVAEVTIEAPQLDLVGRVVDFGVVKEVIGEWIDLYWDHTMLFHPNDPFLKLLSEYGMKTGPSNLMGPKNPFIMPDEMNPTAENMVIVLRDVVRNILRTKESLVDYDLLVKRIRFWETPNCSAEWSA